MNAMNRSQRSAPPTPSPRKEDPINVDYEDRAKRLLREAMDAQGVTIADLTDHLHSIGVTMSKGGVANKISRGGFSAAFMLQCLGAMGIALDTKPSK